MASWGGMCAVTGFAVKRLLRASHIKPWSDDILKKATVFLSDFAKEQFQAVHDITGNSGWCLPSRDGKRHICLKSIAKQIKDRVRSEPLANRTKATGKLLLTGGGWTPHGLRRTGATTMGELGVMGEVIRTLPEPCGTEQTKAHLPTP